MRTQNSLLNVTVTKILLLHNKHLKIQMNFLQYKRFILITGQTLFYYKVLYIHIYQNGSNEFKTVFLYRIELDVHLKYIDL